MAIVQPPPALAHLGLGSIGHGGDVGGGRRAAQLDEAPVGRVAQADVGGVHQLADMTRRIFATVASTTRVTSATSASSRVCSRSVTFAVLAVFSATSIDP